MRIIFGVLSLLLAMAVMGFLIKKQMTATSAVKMPEISAPASVNFPAEPAAAVPASPSLSTATSVQQQSQLIQQQVQQQLRAATEAALQQTRPMQDGK